MATDSFDRVTRPGDQVPLLVCVASDPDLLNLIRRFCSTLPCRTHTTDSAEEALALIGSTQVSLAMADQRLTTMSGSQFLKEVALRSPATARVLLATFPEHQDLIENDEERLHGIIGKPWDGPSLRRTIVAILQWQEERRRMVTNPEATESYNTPTRSIRSFFTKAAPPGETRRLTQERTRRVPGSKKDSKRQ
jgi:DNA-binding NtrC family response regulator